MLQAILAGLLSAAAVTAVVALNDAVSPAHAVARLTPVVVGTLDLSDSPESATFTVPNMAPGDTVARSLTVANRGTLPFRYAMRATVIDDPSGLAAGLLVTAREAVDGTCDAETGALIVERTSPANVAFGSPIWGAQAGDRRLDADRSEVLCFYVELPLSVGNEVAGSATSLSFTFDAEEIRAD